MRQMYAAGLGRRVLFQQAAKGDIIPALERGQHFYSKRILGMIGINYLKYKTLMPCALR